MVKLVDVLYLINARMFQIVDCETGEVVAYVRYAQEEDKVKMSDGLYCYDCAHSFTNDFAEYEEANISCINPNEELTRITVRK